MGNNKIITVSIIGVGARGGNAYGVYINELKDKFKIVSLCDISEVKLKKFGDRFGVSEENRFTSEEEFFKEKRSDVLIVASLDKLHVKMAKEGLNVGYDILLEKPISDDPTELRELAELAREKGRMVMVCHVLRYTVMIRKLKEILDSGAIGQLISIDHTENVVYWHEAHSYVRGNWRRSEDTTPMIMAKCCHDLDLIQYFIGSKCKSVSSMGDLRYFNKEHMPEGASERCLNCKYKETCPYSAETIYLKAWQNDGRPAWTLPVSNITDAYPLTDDAILKSLETTDYGRCVFDCDNDVVDNQTTIMTFENGVTATLKMEAFVKYGGRDIRFFGSEGELDLCEGADKITLKRFNGADEEWKISELKDSLGGKGDGDHGGGDHRMIDRLYEIYTTDKNTVDSSIEKSIESHYMAIAAEESRLGGGKLVELDKYRK